MRAYGWTQVTGIWEYERKRVPGAATRYIADRLLPFRGGIQDQLVEVVLRILDELGFNFGPFHIELFSTPRGLISTDFAARLAGADLPAMEASATGIDPFALTIKVLADEEHLLSDRATSSPAFRQASFSLLKDRVSEQAGGRGPPLKSLR